ncbi:hypothetical protein ACTFIW_000637 [Dictyostelium discoideum]
MNSNNNNNYILYKKVFNNIVISNKIFKFVRYEYLDNDDDDDNYENEFYKIYEIKKGLKRSYDFSIKELLSKKLFKLFDYLFEFYYNVVIFNREKYWKFVSMFQFNEKKDFKAILSYKELGFNRFLKVYNNSKFQFQVFKKFVLKSSAKSGNLEIYNFLMNEKIYEFRKPIKYSKYYRWGGNRTTNHKDYKTSIDCDNNLEIFKNEIKYHNFELTFSQAIEILIKSLKSNNLVYLNYLVNYLIDLEIHLIKFQLPLTAPYDKIVDNLSCLLIGISFTHSSFELAKIILNSDYLSKKFNGNYPLPYIKQHNTKFLDFQILNYFWKNSNSSQNQFRINGLHLTSTSLNNTKDISRSIINSNLEINNFNFNLINYNNDNIIISLLKFNYSPTFQEFKFLIENNNNNIKIEFHKLNWDLIFFNITKKLFDCNYLKFVLDFISNEPSLNDRVSLKPVHFDSKLSIVEFLFNNFENYKTIQFTYFSMNTATYKYLDLFFNDLKSLHLFIEKSISLLKNSNLLITILETSVNTSNLLIFNYLLNNFKSLWPSTFQLRNLVKYIPILNIEYQGFIIFKTIIDSIISSGKPLNYNDLQPSLIGSHVISQVFLIKNPLIYHYLISKNLESRYYFYVDDLNFIKLFFKPTPVPSSVPSSSVPSSVSSILIEQNYSISKLLNNFYNIKENILDYLFLECNLKPSSVVNFNSKEFFNEFGTPYQISKKLCYVIENDSKWVCDNILNIIYNSCKFRDLFYMNLILLNENYSQEIKHHLLINLIFYSIIKLSEDDSISKNYYYDKDDLWFSKLKINNYNNSNNKVLFIDSLKLYYIEISKLITKMENTNQINKFNLNLQSLTISSIENQQILNIISLLNYNFKSISNNDNLFDDKLKIQFN